MTTKEIAVVLTDHFKLEISTYHCERSHLPKALTTYTLPRPEDIPDIPMRTYTTANEGLLFSFDNDRLFLTHYKIPLEDYYVIEYSDPEMFNKIDNIINKIK